MGRDRTDPNRSAQGQMFRGAGERQSSLLNAEGGKSESDIGNTQPVVPDKDHSQVKSSPAGRQKSGQRQARR